MTNSLFSFQESFSLEDLSRIPDSMNLEKTKNYEAVVFRLLSGTASIKHKPTGNVVHQKNFYYDLSGIEQKNYLSSIRQNIKPCTLKIMGDYFKENLRPNFTFYQELFQEFACYFYQVSEFRENYSGGFFHLYRILESISYIFPILWASKPTDGYYGTYDKLKELFSEPTRGELGMFKEFLKRYLEDDEQNIPFIISISSSDPLWLKGYCKIIQDNIAADDILDPYSEEADIYDSINNGASIRIRAIALIDLTINIRNKYFHYLSGRNQCIRPSQIGDPDEFFRSINEQIIAWLSFIFRKILLHEIGLK